MKRKLLLIALLINGAVFSQSYSTPVTTLGTTGMTLKIETNSTNVTLTLTGSSTKWLGIGFGGTSMSSVSDMFIWNSTSSRDYTPSGGQSIPSADASQSWSITSDGVVSGIRTIVATRTLVSSGDYTFLNSNSTIPIIYAIGTSTTLSSHADRGSIGLSRTLGLNKFSLEASSIFPNPTSGEFSIKTQTYLTQVNIYTQTGVFVKTIDIANDAENVELNITGLETGVYLIELKNDTDKSWKKVIVN